MDLPSKHLVEFRAWFEAFDAQNFDTAIERDVEAGKLDKLAEEALNEFKKGRSGALDELRHAYFFSKDEASR